MRSRSHGLAIVSIRVLMIGVRAISGLVSTYVAIEGVLHKQLRIGELEVDRLRVRERRRK
jgi:hypothetical protein